MNRAALVVCLFVFALASIASAQANRTPIQLAAGNGGGGLVRVMVDSPIYVQPDSNREPLRVAKEGSVLRAIRIEGAFTYVEFADPDYPRRFGYIQSRSVQEVVPLKQEPLDLSVPEARQGVPAPLPRPPAAPTTTQVARDPSLVQQPPPAPVVPEQTRNFTPRAVPSRGWLDIDAVRLKSVDRPQQTFQYNYMLFTQPASAAAAYLDQNINVTDFGLAGGVGFVHGIGVSLHFDGQNYSQPAGLGISIPSPYFLNRIAADGSVTAGLLERRERAVDIGAEYIIPSPAWLRVRVFGGPTYFHVTNQMVAIISYDQVASALIPINVVAITKYTSTEVAGWSIGFHVGADAAYFFSRHVGVGGGTRFNRGTVTVKDPLSNQDADLRLGHLALSGGLRLRF
jgi:hypothetical protein